MPVERDHIDGGDRSLVRVAGVSGLLIALSYPVIIALFLVVGTNLPEGEGGQAWLDYLSGNETAWWAIVGLSVFTNVLWIAVACGLYLALRTVDRAWSLVGAGLKELFVILETTVSWPSYAALIGLSTEFSTAATEVERAGIVAGANYGAAVQASDLLPVYAILIPGLGQLVLGLVMRKGGPFGRTTAWLAIVAGALGVIAVLGPLAWSSLDQAIILGSLLSAAWFALTGVRMMKLEDRSRAAVERT